MPDPHTEHPNPRDREQAQLWAYRLFQQPDFYVFDTETTGIDKKAEIVQIAVIDKEGRTVIESLVRPTRPCPPEVTRIHGISNEMLRDAPTLDDIYISLSSKLAASTLIAYNMDFDWRMLQQSVAVYGLPMFAGIRKHCAMLEYARFYGAYNLRQRSYAWQKLGLACTQQKIRVDGKAHSALADARMTLALVHKMAGI